MNPTPVWDELDELTLMRLVAQDALTTHWKRRNCGRKGDPTVGPFL